jgi:hypothetical protein
MQCLGVAKIRSFLILPILLCMVQFGIVLLHNHSADSWYDDKDPCHHLCTDAPHKIDNGAKTFKFTPKNPAMQSTAFHMAATSLIAFHQTRNIFSAFRDCRPAGLFLKRAPPA